MTTMDRTGHQLDTLRHDVHAMRAELLALHEEVAAAARMLAVLSNQAAAAGPHHDRPSHCPTCGSALTHHAAMAGDLMIGTACGWSRFVDRLAGPCEAVQPVSAPAAGNEPCRPWVA